MTRKRKFADGDAIDSDDEFHLADAVQVRMRSRYHFVMVFVLLFASLEALYFPFVRNTEPEHRPVRKDFEADIADKMTPLEFRQAYRMDRDSFNRLHSKLKYQLDRAFFSCDGGTRSPETNRYLVHTKLRLSIAIRFAAGAASYDLKLSHGVGKSTIFKSIWGVVDAVNQTESLASQFPSHKEQRKIAAGFRKMSGASFSKVVGAIDGLLIWMIKPCEAWCKEVGVGSANWRCHRKDKFGFNLQAICDHKLRFTWIDMQWPGSTSDYMAWVTSDLCMSLEKNYKTKTILAGYTLVGDNAYVKTPYMSVPLKGKQSG